MSANSLYEKYFGKNKGGWKEVSQNETLRRANNGYPTVAVWKNSTGGSGHIQVVIPAKNKNTAFAQAGRTVYFGGKLMNVNESVYKTRYYTHD